MKELLTEWRKFVNEDLYDSRRTAFEIEDHFKEPDTTIEELIDEVLNQAEEMSNFLVPDDPEEIEYRDPSAKKFPEANLSDINIYTSNWFENHEVQEEDKEKARALKTFVDWLNRNFEEMLELSYSTEDYSDLITSKPHKILLHISKDNRPYGKERFRTSRSIDMLMSLGPQLAKF